MGHHGAMSVPEPPPEPEHDEQTGSRSHLLPEELAVGSDDPQGQAEAILAESEERTEHPDPDDPQSGRRTSENTV